MKTSKTALRFKITIAGIRPPAWRRIEVPGHSTFWDLHCFIEDAFDWEFNPDHLFVPLPKGRGGETPWDDRRVVGFTNDDPSVLWGWRARLSRYLRSPGDRMCYTRLAEMFDFGGDWDHLVVFEGAEKRPAGIAEPVCVGGRRAAPPRDCGGLRGYYDICRALSGDHDESELLRAPDFYEEYRDYNPAYFDRRLVFFDDPKSHLDWVLKEMEIQARER